jgi:hypothetical protein
LLIEINASPFWFRQSEFGAYHAAWWHGIWGVILGPAVLVSMGAILMLIWRVPAVPG